MLTLARWNLLVLAAVAAVAATCGGCGVPARGRRATFRAPGGPAAAAPRPLAGDDPATSVRRDLTFGSVPPAPDDTLVLAYADDPDTINPITANDTVSEAFSGGLRDAGQRELSRSGPARAGAGREAGSSTGPSWSSRSTSARVSGGSRSGCPTASCWPPREMTARDVKFSFDCVLNKHVEAAALRNYFEDPEAKDESQRCKIKVTVLDDYTVKIRWTKPYFLVEDFTLGGVPIIPRARLLGRRQRRADLGRLFLEGIRRRVQQPLVQPSRCAAPGR